MPIDALAVADVDNDGDLDILASVRNGQLVMWRDAGNGTTVSRPRPSTASSAAPSRASATVTMSTRRSRPATIATTPRCRARPR
jgi:hypothetical protein